jgi:hypothetical protein
MVSAYVLSIDVHRFVSAPLQHLKDGLWFQLISRLGLERFLRCQRQLINELMLLSEPPDPLSYYLMLELPPKNQRLHWRQPSLFDDSQSYKFSPINQSLSLFDIYPQPPNGTRKEKSKP